MSKRMSAALALVLACTLAACGSDDDGGGGGGGAAKESCYAYCDATASCDSFAFTDAAECKTYECDGLDQTSGSCATAFKNYYDCVNAKSDVCDETGCQVDINACM